MAEEVQVVEEQKNDVCIVRVSGRLDAISSPDVEKKILEMIDGGKQKMALDFAGVDYLSSAGMRMLLAAMKKMNALSGSFVVFAIQDSVMDVLKMSGFDHVIALASNEEEAINKVS